MKVDLQGKVALCSASSEGMGFGSALLFAEAGCKVVILARREAELAKARARIAERIDDDVLAIVADVSRKEDIERVVQATIDRFETIDILLNNAGGPPPGKVEDLSDEDWLGAVQLNLMSTIRFSSLVVPHMKKQGWGRIINITSITAKSPGAGMGLSNTMRAGVLGFAKTLSKEVAAHGITVNSLCPGAVSTARFARLLAGDAEEEGVSLDLMRSKVEAGIPVGFVASPADFAQMVLFLASVEARYITGTVMQIDGGEYSGLL